MSSNLAILKEQLEQQFPGKWLLNSRQHKHIKLGIAEIDNGMTQALVRSRISEWTGAISSGKTTFLRSTIARWCASGMKVAYVDPYNKLRASDWADVERGTCSANVPGKFWVVRSLSENKFVQDALWAIEQLIKSAIFDVVIVDLGSDLLLSSKIYARLQRNLERSRTALIMLKDQVEESVGSISSTWGCHSRFGFSWSSEMNCEYGLNGVVSIVPTIATNFTREGMKKSLEVSIRSHVPNRLFTHSQIPDRRAPKART